MGGGLGGGGFRGAKGSTIKISDRKMYQDSHHFNKHGRNMGYTSKKEYNAAAKAFAEKYQNHPGAKVYEGKWNGRGPFNNKTERIITYGSKTVIIDPATGQIIDFYQGTDYRGIIDIRQIR